MKTIKLLIDDFMLDRDVLIHLNSVTGNIELAYSYYNNKPEIGVDETEYIIKLYKTNQTFRDKIDFLFINEVKN